MNEVEDVKRRIARRKKPLTDWHFKKLYNGMMKIMILIIVCLSGAIIMERPQLQQDIMNQKSINQFVTFVSDTIYSFLPQDVQVSQTINYTPLKDNYYVGDGNVIQALSKGKVIKVSQTSMTLLDEHNVEITYKHLKSIQVKKYQAISKDDFIASYDDKFQMTFEYMGKTITYKQYLGML